MLYSSLSSSSSSSPSSLCVTRKKKREIKRKTYFILAALRFVVSPFFTLLICTLAFTKRLQASGFCFFSSFFFFTATDDGKVCDHRSFALDMRHLVLRYFASFEFLISTFLCKTTKLHLLSRKTFAF